MAGNTSGGQKRDNTSNKGNQSQGTKNSGNFAADRQKASEAGKKGAESRHNNNS